MGREFEALKAGIEDKTAPVRAASAKPFGDMPFCPGPGYGGHCIAVDPFYLIGRRLRNVIQA